jgi:hypothetical protein
MTVTPLPDGSLHVDRPGDTAGFDLGNRSLFVKTNGDGDARQIYFAHGAHAGAWKLEIRVDGAPLEFSSANAIGRLWQLAGEAAGAQVTAAVFLDERLPAVFERIEIEAGPAQDLTVEATLTLDITPPPPPKGYWQDVAARIIPRLPAYSGLWGFGWGRWLQTPAPRRLIQADGQTLAAQGRVDWQFTANRAFSACSVRGKNAVVTYSLRVPAGQCERLEFVLVEAGGSDAVQTLRGADAALDDARAYAAWLSSQVDVADPLLRSLYVAGLNAAKAMFKEFPGGFCGLVAGPDYAFPPRIYFRDGYWTAQALIDAAPELVRAHLLHLAAGVHPNGACPSGVFAAHLLEEWKAPANCDADWLADHYDSPAYFILLLNDYLAATGDWALLAAIPPQINPRLKWPALTIGERAAKVIEYLIALDRDGDGLIEKPYKANDWADNIRRSVWVSYDQALYIAALRAYAGWCESQHLAAEPACYLKLADQAQAAMDRELWDEKLGYFVNYLRPGAAEKNLSVDTLVSLYFHLADEPHARRILEAADRLLVARNNREQPYGDYGLLCAYPNYAIQADLFDKSAQPYCYHNGADWPYWDGMFSAILLERSDPAGLDVLTRWWAYGLEQGWLTPVEYYSPPFPVGGMLQGWSSMPAATLRRHLSKIKELIHDKAG